MFKEVFIINKRYIGTAAQCLTDQTTRNTAVVVGELNIANGTNHEISEIVIHEKYNPLTLENDIGLLKTTNEIVFNNSTIKAVTLGDIPLDSILTITFYGWGRQGLISNLPSTLLQATFATVSLSTCLNNFPFAARRFISDRNICTQRSPSATCQGDAGGPLVYNNKVIAIASWTEPCVGAQTNVNTRVSFYNNWITNLTKAYD